jgi:hypothetical protein
MSNSGDRSDGKRTKSNGSDLNPDDRAIRPGVRVCGVPQLEGDVGQQLHAVADDSDWLCDVTEHLFQLELSMAVQMRSVRMQLHEMQFAMNGNVRRLMDHIVGLKRRLSMDGGTVADDGSPTVSARQSVGRNCRYVSRAHSIAVSEGVGDQLRECLAQMERRERQLKYDLQTAKLKADKLEHQLNARKQVAHATKLRQLQSLKKQTVQIKQIVTEIRDDLQKSDAPLTTGKLSLVINDIGRIIC